MEKDIESKKSKIIIRKKGQRTDPNSRQAFIKALANVKLKENEEKKDVTAKQ